MARRRNKKKQQETLVDLVEARDQASSFMEQNQTKIFGGLVALVLIVGGYFAFTYMYKAPMEMESQEQMRQAQTQFERDSFALALTNPGGGYSGFLDIIDNYGGTKAANLANYYAGISYLNLGQYEVAIDYLNDFKANDNVLPITKYGAMAAAYGELQDFDKAISYYKKAINAGDNEFLIAYYHKNIGLLYEKQGNFADSKKHFEEIKTKFPNSSESRDIDKYIARVEAKL
jgi:tetratricopeptide (TPR) repeat protein